MTLANPDHIDGKKWVARTKKKLAIPAGPRAYTILDFKLSWIFRDQFTREELLSILEIAANKRFDNRKDIEVFLSMMANHIDGMETGE